MSDCKCEQREAWDCGCSGYDRFCCGANKYSSQCIRCKRMHIEPPNVRVDFTTGAVYTLVENPTGRLTRTEPDMQNTPLPRDRNTKRMRKHLAKHLLDTDYPGIELRIFYRLLGIEPPNEG